MTIVKGGTAANVLVKTWESSNGTNTTARDTLIRNIGQVLYKDYKKITTMAVRSLPQLRFVKEFEFGFKIRDKARCGCDVHKSAGAGMLGPPGVAMCGVRV